MLASDFQAKLRKLNRNIRIYCGNDDSKPAGVFHVVNGEYTEICGVDKHWLPEHPILDEKGHILKGGWRRVVRLLVNLKLVDRRRAESVFGTQLFGVRQPNNRITYQDPIQKEIDRAYADNFNRSGKPALEKDELMDLAKEINKRYEDKLSQ